MKPFIPLLLTTFLLTLSTSAAEPKASPPPLTPLPIPDHLIALTFDDSVASHATFVAPLLKKLNFGATFFITEGFEFAIDKKTT